MKILQLSFPLLLVCLLSTSVANAVSCNSGDTQMTNGTVVANGSGVALDDDDACTAAKEDAANNVETSIQTEKGNCIMLYDYFKKGTLDNGTCMCDHSRGWSCTIDDAQQDWVCCNNGTL